MQVNYRVIYIAEKAANAFLTIVPESVLRSGKSLFTKNRSSFFSNTKSYFSNRIGKAMNNLTMVKEIAHKNIGGGNVLEFGSGGHGVDLILMYLLGARKIYTLDIRFFGFLYMRQAIRDFEEHLEEISELFGVNYDRLRSRYDQISGLQSVDDIMKAMNITFFKFSDLKKGKIDIQEKANFFFSESNLQRIPLDEIDRLLSNTEKLLADGCVSFHRVDNGDINTQSTRPLYDPNLWKFDFLKYSNLGWKLRTTKRLGSQNRLRQPEFLELFERHGFKNLYCENYLRKEDVEKMKSFNVDKRFKGFTDRENVIGHFRFVSIFHPQKSVNQEFKEKDIYLKTKGFGRAPSVWQEDFGLLQSRQ